MIEGIQEFYWFCFFLIVLGFGFGVMALAASTLITYLGALPLRGATHNEQPRAPKD